ncbi:fluoride efflux transporter CrcB [Pseudobacteroides cellulosolvens]|uniref:Fluoride-specific ion channel FluC n=1 Tax=Pseudobacteroides cellulosolvens ATCC 35603 = DSM 2933 TaxID=398512 RepID=A0A0L6JN76_9FIRM|nr:fluoride efflux transporter CrcB [Pseudobacteroides cellulosolvens]KNY26822.1 CrcB-like protein [Pseudobacteroides cellulosolvens ATCC 35603 = DSM 2933]
MNKILLAGCGGFIGASARYIISIASTKLLPSNFPYGTFIVNVIGCFLIGVIMEMSYRYGNISDNMKVFLTTGILGGLTTFSTFSNETVELFLKGKTITSILNVLLNVILCLVGVYIGKMIISKTL